MADPARHDLELPGCTPEPLMAYLEALGILRLVSELEGPRRPRLVKERRVLAAIDGAVRRRKI
jgi:hypothetical protein